MIDKTDYVVYYHYKNENVIIASFQDKNVAMEYANIQDYVKMPNGDKLELYVGKRTVENV